MNEEEFIDRYVALSRQVFLRMVAEDSFPWKNKQNTTRYEDVETETKMSEERCGSM